MVRTRTAESVPWAERPPIRSWADVQPDEVIPLILTYAAVALPWVVALSELGPILLRQVCACLCAIETVTFLYLLVIAT